MKTVIYNDAFAEIDGKLMPLIKKQLPSLEPAVLKTIKELQKALSYPLHRIEIIIFSVKSERQLREFHKISTLFEGIRLIFVLPFRDREMMALAVQMKASYITYIDSSFQDILSVIEKIITQPKTAV